MKICKYQIKIDPADDISLPKGARILDVQICEGTLMLWAMIDPEQPNERRTFAVLATGVKIERPGQLAYIRTVQGPSGVFPNSNVVWHVFERLFEKYV